MREYGKISPQFWIGKTGKSLRGNPEAQIVAMYLMTSPHAEMTGIFHCPVLYISHETGLSIEGASKGLARLSEVGFSTFEADTDTIFVHEMAKYQIGDDLKPTDNRVVGVQKIFNHMPASFLKEAFFERYKDAFMLEKKGSPSVAPTKPRAGAGAEKDLKALSGKPDVISILDHLNAKAKRDYRAVAATTKMIAARLAEGATVDDCKAVIDSKVAAWATDEKMSAYLRPETLFNATKFASYIGELSSAKPGQQNAKFAGAM